MKKKDCITILRYRYDTVIMWIGAVPAMLFFIVAVVEMEYGAAKIALGIVFGIVACGCITGAVILSCLRVKVDGQGMTLWIKGKGRATVLWSEIDAFKMEYAIVFRAMRDYYLFEFGFGKLKFKIQHTKKFRKLLDKYAVKNNMINKKLQEWDRYFA